MKLSKEGSSEGLVALHPVYMSFHNDEYSTTAANLVDGRPDTFVITTGGFPHDVIFSVGDSVSANVSRLCLYLHEAKEIQIEKCSNPVPNSFSVIDKYTLKRSKEGFRQEEHFDLSTAEAGKGIKYIRLRILSGYSQFVGIFGIEADGEESQQRIAVIHSSPEVVLQ